MCVGNVSFRWLLALCMFSRAEHAQMSFHAGFADGASWFLFSQAVLFVCRTGGGSHSDIVELSRDSQSVG